MAYPLKRYQFVIYTPAALACPWVTVWQATGRRQENVRRRRSITWKRIWPHGVAAATPTLDRHLGIAKISPLSNSPLSLELKLSQ